MIASYINTIIYDEVVRLLSYMFVFVQIKNKVGFQFNNKKVIPMFKLKWPNEIKTIKIRKFAP